MVLVLGKDETKPEMLRSILAQLDYQHQVNSWHAQSVEFKDYLYVPEVYPETKLPFCDHEDEGHVFKVSPTSIIDMCINSLSKHTLPTTIHILYCEFCTVVPNMSN